MDLSCKSATTSTKALSLSAIFFVACRARVSFNYCGVDNDLVVVQLIYHVVIQLICHIMKQFFPNLHLAPAFKTCMYTL